jgi:hypothetical protein
MSKFGLLRIETPANIEKPYVAGAEVSIEGNVVSAAPIAKWTVGRPLHEVVVHCQRKGYALQYLSAHSSEWREVERYSRFRQAARFGRR